MRRKIILLLLTMTVFTFHTTTFADSLVTLYSPDGRTASVSENEVEDYKKAGWYTSSKVSIYSEAGKTAVIPLTELNVYENLGWKQNKEIYIYSADDKKIKVWSSQAQTYKNLGWYTEPVVKIFSNDGRTAIVAKRELASYISAGWNEEKIINIYSADGYSAKIWASQLKTYLDLGWYSSQPVTVYNSEGNTKIVTEDELDYYSTIGYYPAIYNKNDIKVVFMGGCYNVNGDYKISWYVINNSQRSISLSAVESKINGKSVEASSEQEIHSGARQITYNTFYSASLESKSITNINNVTMKLKIYDVNSDFADYTPQLTIY